MMGGDLVATFTANSWLGDTGNKFLTGAGFIWGSTNANHHEKVMGREGVGCKGENEKGKGVG
jgi:hypothetical protein